MGWDGDGIVMRCDRPRPRHDTVGTGSSLCVWFGHSAGLRVAGSMTICAQVCSASQICRPTRPPACQAAGRQAAPWLGEEGATSSSGGPRRHPPRLSPHLLPLGPAILPGSAGLIRDAMPQDVRHRCACRARVPAVVLAYGSDHAGALTLHQHRPQSI